MQKLNRWVYALVGILVLFCGGVIYAWSVLSAPIAAEFPQWTKAQLSVTFTITIIMFCLGCMIGGFFSSRVSPKLYVLAAAVLFWRAFKSPPESTAWAHCTLASASSADWARGLYTTL